MGDSQFDKKLRQAENLLTNTGKVQDQSFQDLLNTASLMEDDQMLDFVIDTLQPISPPTRSGINPLGKPIPGQIRLGEGFHSRYPVQVDPWDFPLLLVGMNQQGKTTCILNILHQLVNLQVTFTAIDKKRDYRNLTKLHSDIYSLDLGSLWSNILFEPPIYKDPEHARQYSQKAMHLFCQEKGLGDASQSVAQNIIDKLFKKFKGKRLPTIHDFLEELKRAGKSSSQISSTGQALNRLIQRVRSFAESFPMGCAHSPLEEIFNNNVVLERDKVDIKHARLMTMSLYLWYHHYKLWNPDTKRQKIDHVWIIDEALDLLHKSDEKSSFKGLNAFYSLIPLQKELGDVMICASQNGMLNKSFLDNCSTIISFKLVNYKDRSYLASMMGLDYRDQELLNQFLYLKPGQALVRIADKWPQVMKVNLDDFPLTKDLTDQEVQEHSQEFRKQYMSKVKVITKDHQKEKSRNEKNQDKTTEELLYLLSVYRYPEMGVRERIKFLDSNTDSKWYGSKESRIREKLIASGWVKEVKPRQVDRKPPLLLDLTAQGMEKLKDRYGDKLRKRKGKGGARHRYVLKQVASYFSQYDHKWEVKVGEVEVDLVMLGEEGKRAAAVQCATSTHYKREARCLLDLSQEGSMDKIILVSDDHKILRNIKEKVEKMSNQQETSMFVYKHLNTFLNRSESQNTGLFNLA